MLYYATAFFCGMVVMMLELSASRLIAPYFGNSLFVWTNVIGLVLLGLSLGYYLGGRWADEKAEPKHYFSLVLGAGLWVFCTPFLASSLLPKLLAVFPNFALTVGLGSFLAVLLLFVLPMVFLGMIVPFTVKLLAHQLKDIGSVSGRVSMVSTFGSLCGTFLPAFVLIPMIGTFRSFFLAGAILIALALFALRRKGGLVLLGIFLGLIWSLPVSLAQNVIYDHESSYGHIFVQEDAEGRLHLHVDHFLGTQSIYDPDHLLTEHYYSSFMALPTLVKTPKSILILGHAGGSFTRLLNAFYPDIKVTGVELDPAVTEAARATMDLDKAEVNLVHADARAFLSKSEERYDLIFIDTYHNAQIPAHLATQEFFELVQAHLTEEGVAALNVASKDGDLLWALENTFAKVFGSAQAFLVPGSYNTMVFSGDLLQESVSPEELRPYVERVHAETQSILFDPQKNVFTDDKSSLVDLLSEKMWLNLLTNYKL